MRAIKSAGCLALVALLSACGGGGAGTDSSSGAAASTTARIVPSPSSVSASTFVNAADQTHVTVALDMENIPDSARYVGGGYTNHGIDSVALAWPTANSASLDIFFKLPAGLSPGVYTDTVSLRVCIDSACANVVPGTSITIAVTYAVNTARAGQAPSLTMAQRAFAATGHLRNLQGIWDGPTTVSVPVDLQNFGTPAFISVSGTTNALGATSWGVPLNGAGQFILNVRLPADLGAGTFHDTVTVTVCLDSSCMNPVAGSPFQITFDYQILDSTGTVDGSNGYTWKLMDIAPSAMFWDPVSQRLLGSINPVAGDTGSLVAINPVTATVDWQLDLDARPGAIAVSNDGQYVYLETIGATHEIRKLRLSDRTLVNTLPLASDQSVVQLLVAPGAPDLLAVTTSTYGTGDSILLYGAGGLLLDHQDIVDTVYTSALTAAWGQDASALYSYNARTDDLAIFNVAGGTLGTPAIHTVDLNGVYEAWSALHYDHGLLVENHGGVYDIASAQTLGTFALQTPSTPAGQLPYSSTAAPDFAGGRSFFWYLNSGTMTLQSFDVTTQQSLAYIPVGGRVTFQLLRWGTDGLAFIDSQTTDRLALVTGPFVAAP